MANPVEKADEIRTERLGLDRVLARLVRPERLIYGKPISAGVGTDDLLCCVLREIDETILPREFVIESKVFGTIRLSVSNRRLAAIRFDHDVDNTPLVDAQSTHDMAVQFSHVLKQAFETSQQARILRPRRLPPGTSFNMSCSAQSLAEAAGLSDFRHSDAETVAKFGDVISQSAIALTSFGSASDAPKSKGSAEDLAILEKFHDNFQSVQQTRRQARRVNANEPRCLVVPFTQDRSMVLAVRETGHLAAIVPADTVDRVMQAWHAERGHA